MPIKPRAVVRADEFDGLRLRWIASLNAGPGINQTDPEIATELGNLSTSAQSYWTSMDKSAGRSALWSDLNQLATLSSQITSSYGRLRTLATAYATAGSTLAGNAALRADLLDALDWLHANYYNLAKSEYYNWWDWEIGTPLALNDITALLYDDLSATRRTNYMDAANKFTPGPGGTVYTPDPGFTGLDSFRYTYTRRKLAIDLLYQPEMSGDLVHWDHAGSQVAQVVLADTPSAEVIG